MNGLQVHLSLYILVVVFCMNTNGHAETEFRKRVNNNAVFIQFNHYTHSEDDSDAEEIWKEVVEYYQSSSTKAIFMEINCSTEKVFCNTQNIRKFPVLSFYERSNDKGVTYSGEMKKKNIQEWIAHILKYIDNGVVKKEPLTTVTAKNFSDVKTTKNTFIMFYMNWCELCKELRPIFEDAAKHFLFNNNIIFGQYACENNYEICQAEDVGGYPTFRLFQNGIGYNYYGERTVKGFIDHLTERVPRDEL